MPRKAQTHAVRLECSRQLLVAPAVRTEDISPAALCRVMTLQSEFNETCCRTSSRSFIPKHLFLNIFVDRCSLPWHLHTRRVTTCVPSTPPSSTRVSQPEHIKTACLFENPSEPEPEPGEARRTRVCRGGSSRSHRYYQQE